MTSSATPLFVRLAADKNIDKTIAKARHGARTSGLLHIIEKEVARRDGSLRRIPILEVTPAGDVLEVPAAPLRVMTAQHITDADLDRRMGRMNARAARGHDNFARIMEDTRNYLQAAADLARDYRQQRQHRQAARTNRHTTTQTDSAPRHAA